MMTTRRNGILAGILIFFFFCGTLGGASQSHAKNALKQLSEENIAGFIEKTTEITSGQALEMSPGEVVDYLERHIDKNARFKSTLKYNIPGYPAQETSLGLNKKEFIESIESGAQALQDYDSSIKIKQVNISDDKTKATVFTEGWETGVMPVSADGTTTQYVPVEGVSNCNQILTLSKKGVIQMFSAVCTTEVNFRTYD